MTDPTANHNLRRPEKGAQNWHVPLNENFSKIDRQVEIRDSEANLSEYEPVEGGKFLASDSGAVYIGDGSQWRSLGSVGGDIGRVLSPPGRLQATIDETAAGHQWGAQAMQTVSLISGATYQIEDTLKLRAGTRLDCNGAVIEPQGDFNAVELRRDTELLDARINVSQVNNYSSACISIVADNNKIGTQNPATVSDCHLFNDDNTGVGLQFRGVNHPVSIQRASGTIQNFDIGVEFRAEGTGDGANDGWCNGNRFEGAINGSRIPVYLQSTNGSPVGGNTVRGQVQCGDNCEWVVRQEDAPDGTDLRGNTYFLHIWDSVNVTNEFESSSNRTPPRSPLWYIGTGQQEYNSLRSLTGSHSNDFTLNRSPTGRARNAICTGIGDAASRGAVDFNHPSTFASNDAPFHPDS